MECTACGRDNRLGASFCEGCGVSLARVCPQCGAQLRSSARFCDACGQPAAAPPSPGKSVQVALPVSVAGGRYQVERFLGEGAKTRVCLALAHAHERGIVHRDLKPANVWLTRDGTAKLGDFGLALALDRSRLTVEGMMVGTVTYMPPEQALGRAPDGRSDLYGLGAMLYEMVTGRPPFLGDDVVAIVSQHIHTSPVAPSWHNPEIPRALEALIMRLLAKVPEERPENAAAVRQALAAVSEAARAGQPPLEAQANPL